MSVHVNEERVNLFNEEGKLKKERKTFRMYPSYYMYHCDFYTTSYADDDDDQPLYGDSGNRDDSEDDDAPLDISNPLN